MAQQKIILTGGHTGIGLELTKRLLKEGAKIGLVIRNEKRKGVLSDTVDVDQIDFFYGDLSVHADVVRVAKEIATQWGTVDVLFNNAGVLLDDVYKSEQGNEMHFEVNTLAPLLLSKTLRTAIGTTAKMKIVSTVTDFLFRQKKLDVESLLSIPDSKIYQGRSCKVEK